MAAALCVCVCHGGGGGDGIPGPPLGRFACSRLKINCSVYGVCCLPYYVLSIYFVAKGVMKKHSDACKLYVMQF